MKINSNKSSICPNGSNMKIAIVFSRFNDKIGRVLLTSVNNNLYQCGVKKSDLSIFNVPGALEIPLTAKKIAQTKKYDAIIALGIVIRGKTYHFELVSHQSHSGLMQVSLETGIPVVYGILTANNEKQAKERASEEGLNKGKEFAHTAIETIQTLKLIK